MISPPPVAISVARRRSTFDLPPERADAEEIQSVLFL